MRATFHSVILSFFHFFRASAFNSERSDNFFNFFNFKNVKLSKLKLLTIKNKTIMTKTSFCGIFATLFVTTTMVLLASCSQDDDYYESDMYTLAEMGTRLVGDGEDTSPAFSKIADMGSVLIDFKNMMDIL